MRVLKHKKRFLACCWLLLMACTSLQAQDCKPTVLDNQTFTIAENLATGSLVGQLQATQCSEERPLGGWTITVGNELGVFEINGATGVITIQNEGLLDAESNQFFRLKATVSDGLMTSDESIVEVHVTNVNDNAATITPDQVFEVVETAQENATVGTIQYTDDDLLAESLTWTISGGNEANIFAISEAEGTLTLQNSGLLDAEVATSMVLEITLGDGVHLTEESVVVQVLNANDTPPVVTSGQSFELNEIADAGDVLGSLQASDADGETLYDAWTITNGNVDLDGDQVSAFAFDEEGNLIVADADDLDYGIQSIFELAVTVSDGINRSEPTIVGVTLIDFDREDCDNDGIPNYEDLFSCETFNVPVAFTPNGDGQNDRLIIEGLENYPGNLVKIVNRWGATVWEAIGYNNQEVVFEGFASDSSSASVSGSTLPEGTYFYFIDARDGRDIQKGFTTIKR